ncbi:hypothetical protein [Paenibacillus sp. FSL H7-0918]|uniref:hypothetical protein n=1 Tax=Paenibacillus sp. FSL H7-0918 TaxID=2921442 RepID=UPI0030F921EE
MKAVTRFVSQRRSTAVSLLPECYYSDVSLLPDCYYFDDSLLLLVYCSASRLLLFYLAVLRYFTIAPAVLRITL